MRQLNYNDSSQVLRLEFPDEWDPAAINSITLTILDRDATELLAASALTMYTATTFNAAVERYLDEFVLASGATALVPGDMIHLACVEGPEVRRVKGYDSSTRTVKVEKILDREHAAGDAVTAMWATITVDTSTVATWTAGLPVTLIWTPDAGQPFKETAQVSKSSLQIEGLEERFSMIYPRAYADFIKPVDKLSDMRAEAERQLKNELGSHGLDIDRIVDQDTIAPVVMARMAWLWTLNGDEAKEDERAAIGAEYNALVAQLKKQPIWTDDNQDNVQDDDEVTDHSWFPLDVF